MEQPLPSAPLFQSSAYSPLSRMGERARPLDPRPGSEGLVSHGSGVRIAPQPEEPVELGVRESSSPLPRTGEGLGVRAPAVRVGVISDTHIAAVGSRRVIPPAVLEAFREVDLILHAGDATCRAVLDRLASLAPVQAVTGNVDEPELAYELPTARLVHLGGISIGLTHGHLGDGPTTPQRALRRFAGVHDLRAVVFGHSHEPSNEARHGPHGDVLLFNPGSPTERRRQPRPSFGLLTVRDGTVRGEVVYL